ncbi:MAG: arginine--tRNA ligase [Candidatus Nanoarchaeia archaeon]
MVDIYSEFLETVVFSLVKSTSLSEDEIKDVLEKPKDSSLGDLAFPCFILAKKEKKSPQIIAQELAKKVSSHSFEVTCVGPYLNFKQDKETFKYTIISQIFKEQQNFGSLSSHGKTVVIDYSSPNVAKNMGIHNLRSTLIGQAVANILRFTGYHVVGINHLGDWGTQFGKLIWAAKKWSSKEEIEEKGLVFLNSLYVRFHDEIESLQKSGDKSEVKKRQEEARKWFKKIESGQEEAKNWWELFVKVSLSSYNKLYERLGVRFNHTTGESFYLPLLEKTMNLLEEKGLVKESEGAKVVPLQGFDAPCLLKKKDGATLYATRDITALLYRVDTFQPEKILYFTDIAQEFHFKQVFAVARKVVSSSTVSFEHVSFGRLRFADGAMSTRKGNIVPAVDVLDTSVNKVKKIITQKNPDLENKNMVAEKVGVGAVIFADLLQDRVHNIVFDWDAVLDFQGDSAPYIQYAFARVHSILDKAEFDSSVDIDVSVLSLPEEISLLKKLSDFKQVVLRCSKDYKPHHLARYLLELSREYNSYYVKHKVLQEDLVLQNARLGVLFCVAQVLQNGLSLLGIKAPLKM